MGDQFGALDAVIKHADGIDSDPGQEQQPVCGHDAHMVSAGSWAASDSFQKFHGQDRVVRPGVDQQ